MKSQQLTITINLPLLAAIIIAVLVHGVGLMIHTQRNTELAQDDFQIKVLDIRKVGVNKGSLKNDIYLPPSSREKAPKHSSMDPFKAARETISSSTPTLRPGASPKTNTTSAMNQLKQETPKSLKEFIRETQIARINDINSSPTLSNSNLNVKVEMPKGVREDELNEFELKFYSFQKRLMIEYIQSIILQIRSFERSNPHLSLASNGKQVMTSKAIFDKEGNLVQIKTIQWSKEKNLQTLFDEALKSMNALPNPPQEILEEDDHFVVYYNFTVNS